MKKINLWLIVGLQLFGVLVSNVYAESLETCMMRKASEATPATTKTIFSDQGCDTEGTGGDGVRHDCDLTLCWDSPPNHVIIDAVASEHSGNGSEHSFSGPSYQPTRDAATRVCFSVHAKGPSGHWSGSGWEKINATAQIKHIPQLSEMVVFARTCNKEGAE